MRGLVERLQPWWCDLVDQLIALADDDGELGVDPPAIGIELHDPLLQLGDLVA